MAAQSKPRSGRADKIEVGGWKPRFAATSWPLFPANAALPPCARRSPSPLAPAPLSLPPRRAAAAPSSSDPNLRDDNGGRGSLTAAAAQVAKLLLSGGNFLGFPTESASYFSFFGPPILLALT
ncbi:hypothetical protein E2562_010468 [Oryza meyeriana var. granulata]|uniref:Uncharacterized protein n=1 Tax=Oryza meyeriana var. granulata TaxID=110450 RepID=A0A6G1F6U6_9ORYZ|nr:hypothetical protein E2562_010468 [Oryza meyeriana var. granulata]